MKRWLLFFCIVSLSACGGGSSSGGGASREGVRFFHGSILLPPQFFLDQPEATEFAELSGYRRFDREAPQISVAGVGLTLVPEARRQTVLLFGNSRARVLTEGFEKSDPQNAGIRVIHALDQVSTLRLVAGGESRTAGFGEAGSFIELSPGEYRVQVEASDGSRVFDGLLALDAGQNRSVFITGQAGLFTKTVISDE